MAKTIPKKKVKIPGYPKKGKINMIPPPSMPCGPKPKTKKPNKLI
jgi:hypothetical protein